MLSPILYFIMALVQAYLISLCFMVVAFFFSLQIEGKTFHLQKDFYLLYCDSLFIMVVWNPKHNIFEV